MSKDITNYRTLPTIHFNAPLRKLTADECRVERDRCAEQLATYILNGRQRRFLQREVDGWEKAIQEREQEAHG